MRTSAPSWMAVHPSGHFSTLTADSLRVVALGHPSYPSSFKPESESASQRARLLHRTAYTPFPDLKARNLAHLLLFCLTDQTPLHPSYALVNNLRQHIHDALRLSSSQSFTLQAIHEEMRVEMTRSHWARDRKRSAVYGWHQIISWFNTTTGLVQSCVTHFEPLSPLDDLSTGGRGAI